MKGMVFTPGNHQAIRDKLKTQTRRLDHLKEINKEPNDWTYHPECSLPELVRFTFFFDNQKPYHRERATIIIKPRYRVGETVYIKEAWYLDTEGDIFYKLDWIDRDGIAGKPGNGKWKTPFFMPEWAARDYIKITGIRYERLTSITPENCKAEGVSVPYQSAWESQSTDYRSSPELLKGYQVLWDSINPSQKWDTNPWCVAYSFVKTGKPEWHCP